ncbi:Phosphoribosylformylglycinamidine synthase subunit PurL [Polystyrenella longa]|uniref:Phosphoribosylformylglycinamidine synthase subunit PurL n=1 Tax=Polystyrenella longa TaxID=2528007 RepID=A0A518CJS5_9PLAN|nr:phosphoribosylformylglycinamidine synthase subunit PurL [Polystyrenella longa]QDU79424.1 Phosphoribosylformylglycinamidine synthase subunit PurL [Polystyrenella longa]
MLWEIEISPVSSEINRESERVLVEAGHLGADSVKEVHATRSFLIEGPQEKTVVEKIARNLLADTVVENFTIHSLPTSAADTTAGELLLNVLFKSGVTDNVASSTQKALASQGIDVTAVSTCRKYTFNNDAKPADLQLVSKRVLANDAIEQIVEGPLQLTTIGLGSDYEFELITVPIRTMSDSDLEKLAKEGQLYLSLVEMQTIQKQFQELDRDPTDIELETVAQTWSEHCSHKTLAGRIHYVDESRDLHFENMLKETIFAATVNIRKELGDDDWCVSVFSDNAGIVKFDEKQNVCIKVETHNHPSALEPYGGANTGMGGVIRDPLGTGLGAKPVCNTDVFCFADPKTAYSDLPPGTLHPKAVMEGVVAGVRDYGNRMGIPTVNGSVFFDDRYLGNPLVYCGNVAMIPTDKCFGNMSPGDYIVAVGGRTGRDGIHGATFSSAELTEESESLSGGAVQIGNAITEKMMHDVILEARDRNLYSALTDCGAGGFSSAVGEMGEKTGAEVWLEKCPLKYSGLAYHEIWISEAQERMVLAVPPMSWEAFEALCAAEGVEATIIGKFTDTKHLVLKYEDQIVGDVSMEFLHDGRPPVIREANYQPPASSPVELTDQASFNEELKAILGSLNVCSKEWIIRQYDHEVQAGSVVKPLVGAQSDGPADAAVVRPDLTSSRGLVISNGMNPEFGDFDPYWMAASAIDEAVRNCVAVGADPSRIAILDNFCWGNCEKPEVLGSLVRAALACQEVAQAFGTPFVSGKDSLNNEFSYLTESGEQKTVAIPSTLLISALGQIPDVKKSLTMDLKEAGNRLYLIGNTKEEMAGSHYLKVTGKSGGQVPQVDLVQAPLIFQELHDAIMNGTIRSCHDLSEGGLAVALAEMSFAGELGIDVDLSKLLAQCELSEAVALFSESNTRFVVEVIPQQAEAFEAHFEDLPLVVLGEVTNNNQVIIKGKSGKAIIDADLYELKTAWKSPLAW